MVDLIWLIYDVLVDFDVQVGFIGWLTGFKHQQRQAVCQQKIGNSVHFPSKKKSKSTSKYVDFTTDIMGAAGLTACVYIYAPLSAA